MQLHELKCLHTWFEAIRDGSKTAELRFDDREYAIGDILFLREVEFSPKLEYTSRDLKVRITHILNADEDMGLRPGYVMLSFTKDY